MISALVITNSSNFLEVEVTCYATLTKLQIYFKDATLNTFMKTYIFTNFT